MPRVLQVREVCELALEKIGAYSVNDTGADPAEMERARDWLDILIGHVGARRRAWWLVPETKTVTLVAGQEAYDLAGVLGDLRGIEAVIGVRRVLRDGTREEALEEGQDGAGILRRSEWDALDRTETAGRTRGVYIDRVDRPTLRVWPKPADPVTHDLRITYQRFSADTVTLGPTQRIPDVRSSWNLYLAVALAAQIGNGPVRKLPADEVRDMQQEADRLLGDLEAWEGQEHAAEPRRTVYNDF